jgi:hypothetical protein
MYPRVSRFIHSVMILLTNSGRVRANTCSGAARGGHLDRYE